jgi:cbb3-type cytochrome oxidase cytochrome c subunit
MASIEDLAKEPDDYFIKMSERYPEKFKAYFGEPDSKAYAHALLLGREVYVGEGCWHCHSQYVRPVSNEDQRFGPVSTPTEYQNVLQMPQMFGTRRVGPDLIRVGGKYDNAWHFSHLMNPPAVVKDSVMPAYPWLFDAQGEPNEKGMALVAYLQWLGSWPKIASMKEDWEETSEPAETPKQEAAEHKGGASK